MLQPWELFEQDVARALGGYRISRNAAQRESAPDVRVTDLDLVVDAKLRRGFVHHEFIRAIRDTYCSHGGIPVLVTRSPNEPDAYLTLRLIDFVAIITELRSHRANGGAHAQ
jgi:hypothetical protein